MLPQPGHVYRVTAKASVQFAARHPFLFRMIRVHEWKPYCEGWLWLEGYEVTPSGEAVSRRTIYVRPDGLIAKSPIVTPRRTRPVLPTGAALLSGPAGTNRPTNRTQYTRTYTDVNLHHRR